MSETTTFIIQGGALGLLIVGGALTIRYLSHELKEVRRQLQDLENALLKNAGLPVVNGNGEKKP